MQHLYTFKGWGKTKTDALSQAKDKARSFANTEKINIVSFSPPSFLIDNGGWDVAVQVFFR